MPSLKKKGIVMIIKASQWPGAGNLAYYINYDRIV